MSTTDVVRIHSAAVFYGALATLCLAVLGILSADALVAFAIPWISLGVGRRGYVALGPYAAISSAVVVTGAICWFALDEPIGMTAITFLVIGVIASAGLIEGIRYRVPRAFG